MNGHGLPQEHSEEDLIDHIGRRAALSPSARAVLSALRWHPLGSGDDLSAVIGRPVHGVLKDLQDVRDARLAGSDQLGCTRKQRQRWHLSDHCLEEAGLSGATWHDASARSRLYELLPSVERFYQVTGRIKTLGGFCEFQWLDATGDQGPSCDAAARYEHGWVALFWCGSLVSEVTIADRLARFPLDCQALAVGASQPWPSQIHLVVADAWERELASRVLEDFGMDGIAGLWCIADDTVTEPTDVGISRGWIHQPVRRRSGRSSWEETMAGSLWAGAGGLQRGSVLRAVVESPGARIRYIKALLHEPPEQTRVGKAISLLLARGLLLSDGQSRGARYFATSSGLNLVALQDRVHVRHARSRTGLSQWQEASPRPLRHTVSKPHEDGLRALLEPFVARGCPVANGVRYEEKLGSAGGIAPDAMLHLKTSPYGEGWHHVEYERSARGEARVSGKVRGYGSNRRRDRYPTMVACADDRAEGEFQEQSRKLGIALVTTTLARLKDHGPVENTQCWSMYGQGVRLG